MHSGVGSACYLPCRSSSWHIAHGTSAGSVIKIARPEALSFGAGASRTATATAARQIDMYTEQIKRAEQL